MPPDFDPKLHAELLKAYTARAKLFHNGVQQSRIDLLIAEIDSIDGSNLAWLEEDGVLTNALQRVRNSGGKPHLVFAHPEIIQERPYMIAYYRRIAISKKGLGQLQLNTESLEVRRDGRRPAVERVKKICATLNKIISDVIESLDGFDVALSREVIVAQLGTELQGTWANVVGKGASKAVEELLFRYITVRNLGSRISARSFQLTNGWTITFASEPDVSFRDENGRLRIAVEIKGSLSIADAQTRYGETKKSFGKALTENPRCHTIYLASCFTTSVINQIRADGQVRDWFNLTSVLYDDEERELFLQKLFHIIETPT
jgi:hypothetical protein